nr:unnamed protein product [Digitaria exilis]
MPHRTSAFTLLHSIQRGNGIGLLCCHRYATPWRRPRLAARRLSTATAAAAPCPLDPPQAPPPALPPPQASTSPFHPLVSHQHPAVAAFPHAGFSGGLADDPLLARAVHGLAVRRALPLSVFHRNTLLAFYFRHRSSPAAALHLFDEMPHRTFSSWYTAVSGCVRCGLDTTAFELLRRMREDGVPLSGFALASLVTACERRGWEEGVAWGAAMHALTQRAGLMANVYIGTALLHLYGSRGLVSDARRLFWEMQERNIVSWTALMVALSSNGYLEEALAAYRRMRREGVTCNANAFATVASLCGSLEDEAAGLQVAAHVVVSGLQTHVSVANSLITMFGNLGRVQAAERLFDRMEERDRISWNAMISMYSHTGACGECFVVLSDMRHGGVRPDVTTLCSVVSVCASSDHVDLGSGVHSLCHRNGLHSSVLVGNALVNMYSAAGRLDEAESLFWNMSRRDVISWNTIISSYVQNDNCVEALQALDYVHFLGRSMEAVLGALPSLLPKLGELLVGEYSLQKEVKGGIRFLQSELESMQGALEKISGTPADQLDNQDKIWANDVRDLSYDIEDIVDTFMVQSKGRKSANQHGFKKVIDRSLNLLMLPKICRKIATDIRDIRTRVEEVSKRRDRYKIDGVVAKPVTTTVNPRLLAQYKKATELIGIERARDELIKIMTEENEFPLQQGKIVSIVGFGGLGKTTLASAVYEKIKARFDCCAFVPVSQTPDMKKVLNAMIYDLSKQTNKETLDERQLIDELRVFLQDKSLWGFSGVVVFQQGGMPLLTCLRVQLLMQEAEQITDTFTVVKFDHGYLPSLQEFYIDIRSRGIRLAVTDEAMVHRISSVVYYYAWRRRDAVSGLVVLLSGHAAIGAAMDVGRAAHAAALGLLWRAMMLRKLALEIESR